MTREDNKALGKTTAYTYDTNGNILTKVMYAFTLGSLEEKTPLIVIPYSYKANGRRDQMTKYNGELCEYDNMGNPTTYRDRKTTFKYGGRMIAMGDNTYAYDAMGERLSKTVNGVETRFIAASGKVVRSVTNGVITDFYYDNYGLSVIKHDGKTYYVRKNVLGDVTHIYDENGDLAAKYEYDAWGNHKVLKADGTEDEDASSIGNVNPIRYRGYFFDTETGLYFLKARYYDPETGRFISQDDTQFLDPNTVNGLNLYAYCGNNPVMNVDPSGRFALLALALAGLAFGTFMGGVFSGLSEMAAGGNFLDGFLGGLVSGFITTLGLALGGVIGTICPPIGLLVAGFSGVIGSVVGGIVTEGVKTDWNISSSFWETDFLTNVLPSAILNGVANMLSFGLGNLMGAGGYASSFLKNFGSWLAIGGFSISATLAISFPIFAIGLLPIMLTSSKKGVIIGGAA